jgi:N-acetyl-gamma-glutamylphosphate reductase
MLSDDAAVDEVLLDSCIVEARTASDKHHQAVLVARLDNLGKGASGAAVQNMRLMLGLADI